MPEECADSSEFAQHRGKRAHKSTTRHPTAIIVNNGLLFAEGLQATTSYERHHNMNLGNFILESYENNIVIVSHELFEYITLLELCHNMFVLVKC